MGMTAQAAETVAVAGERLATSAPTGTSLTAGEAHQHAQHQACARCQRAAEARAVARSRLFKMEQRDVGHSCEGGSGWASVLLRSWSP